MVASYARRVFSGRMFVGVVAAVMLLLATAGCNMPSGSSAPPPAVIRQSAPPWSAPRDAVSYIDEAGLVAEPLDTTTNQRIIDLEVVIDGQPVEIPAYLGIDRIRALQAAAHTHDTSGEVWLEGSEAAEVTLGQFFILWGVRFDGECLGAACGGITVLADGNPVSDPLSLVLATTHTVRVEARS